MAMPGARIVLVAVAVEEVAVAVQGEEVRVLVRGNERRNESGGSFTVALVGEVLRRLCNDIDNGGGGGCADDHDDGDE